MTRVFVTGASGFIGSHLVRQLIERGHNVTALVRPTADPSNISGFPREKFRPVRGNLLDPSTIRPAIEGCGEVYHLAGAVMTNPAYRRTIVEANYTSTINLFDACLTVRPRKIVYLASIFALAKGSKDRPADEETPYNLTDMAQKIPYFDAKRRAELASYEYLTKGLPLVHVYPTICLGPGDVYLSSSKFIVAHMKGLLRAYIPGGWNFMDVRDAASGLILGMEKGKVGEKYLIGDHNVPLEDFFTALDRVTGKKTRRIAVPRRAAEGVGRVLEILMGRYAPFDRASALLMGDYWYYDSSKARRELGFRGRLLEETLSDAVAWFTTHRFHLVRR